MSNRHYLINSEDLQNLNARLLSIAFSKDEGDWKSIMHTHHFTELLFVVSGEGSFSFNQEQSPLRRGDLVIIPPYTEHTERSSQNHPLEYYVLGICKFCSNGTPILKLAVHSFWFSGTRFLLKTVRFSFIIVM